MEAFSYVKTHPYMTGATVFVGGVLLVLLFRGHGVTPVSATQTTVAGYDPGYNAAVVAANTSLMQTQLAIQSHAQDTAASLQAHLSDNQTAYDIAGITGQVTNNANSFKASVDSQAIAAGVTTQQLTNQHDIAIASMSRDVALAVNATQNQANSYAYNADIQKTQDAATIALTQSGYDYSRGIQQDQDAATIALQKNAFLHDISMGTIANQALDIQTRGAVSALGIQTSGAVTLATLQAQQAISANNNSTAVQAQTIQVASNNYIAANNNATLLAQTQAQVNAASSIAKTQANAATDQAIINGVAGVAKVGVGAFL